MLNKKFLTKSIIIFPSNEGKSEICDFLYQTSRILAKKNVVIVINIQQAASCKEILVKRLMSRQNFTLLKKKEGVYYFTPLLFLPFRRFKKIVRLNLILNILALQLTLHIFFTKPRKRILWHFFPQLSFLHQYFGKEWQSIYDIIDYYTSPDLKLNQELNEQKKYLLEHVTVVTAISTALKKVYLSLVEREIYLVPQGFSLELFQLAEKKVSKGPTLPKAKPIIGFIGHINERLDFKLLLQLIKLHQNWRFVFVGPKETNANVSLHENYSQVEKIFKSPNVLWLDQQPKKLIPGIVKQFSIGMIPYDLSYEFNRFCYPMKVFEYFYQGKPVISTDIESLHKLTPYLITVNDAANWETEIRNVLAHPWPKEYSAKQKRLAIANSWENKIQSIVTVLPS